MAEMVIIDGTRYKPQHLKALGLSATQADPVPEKRATVKPRNKARKAPEPVEPAGDPLEGLAEEQDK